MTTNNHTDISSGAAANAATFNSPLGQLDAAIGNRATLGIAGTPTIVAALGTAAMTTTAQTVIGAINEVDADLTAIVGGATASAQQLKDWATGECYEMTSAAYDADQVITGGTVKWPDSSAGVFATTTKNSTWLAVDAFTISHAASSQTVTQAAVTRDSNGQVTVKPALTVA